MIFRTFELNKIIWVFNEVTVGYIYIINEQKYVANAKILVCKIYHINFDLTNFILVGHFFRENIQGAKKFIKFKNKRLF